MALVEKRKSLSQLLACCFTALFLIAQTQASAHVHNEAEDGAPTECALCLIGSQLDDAVEADVEPCISSRIHASLAPRPEDLFAPLSAPAANARAPPDS